MKNILISSGLALLAHACTPIKTEPPNIVFVMMDDLGYGQFAANNDTLQTNNFDPYFVSLVREYSPQQALEFSKKAAPNLTILAKRGAFFSSAFACNNLCAPSRLGIATGYYPSRYGVYENSD
jgi:uncharacterized sulfatase